MADDLPFWFGETVLEAAHLANGGCH